MGRPNYVFDRICGPTTRLDVLYHVRYYGVNHLRREARTRFTAESAKFAEIFSDFSALSANSPARPVPGPDGTGAGAPVPAPQVQASQGGLR
jgi:hypothetical protein